MRAEVLFHYVNVMAHKVTVSVAAMRELKLELLEDQPYPDVAHVDFYLFPPLKKNL